MKGRLLEVTYEDFINNILETRGRNGCGDEYHETHHIVPKCMGGSNDKENLIDLFAREHFEAHRLLALENPENEKLTYAWWMMSHVKDKAQDRYQVTAEEYEEARIAISIKQKEEQTKRMKSKKARKRISNTLKGRYVGDKNPRYGKHCSEETKSKISNANKGKFSGEKNYFYGKSFRGEESPMYGHQHTKESKEKMSKSLKGKYVGENNPNYGKPMSDKQRAKISEALKGKMAGVNNPMFGKYHSEDTKEKIRKKATGRTHLEETKLKMSKNRKGKDNANAKITCQFDINIELIHVWEYADQAARSLNINRSAISMVCMGTHKSAGGFIWRYLYDQTKQDGTVISGAITLGLITEEEALKQLKEQENLKGEN